MGQKHSRDVITEMRSKALQRRRTFHGEETVSLHWENRAIINTYASNTKWPKMSEENTDVMKES